MSPRKARLFISLLDRLNELLEKHIDIFFEERPFLTEEKRDPVIRFMEEWGCENYEKIKKIIEILSIELVEEIPKKTFTGEQGTI